MQEEEDGLKKQKTSAQERQKREFVFVVVYLSFLLLVCTRLSKRNLSAQIPTPRHHY
jgi:hypothetical protein